MKRSFPLPIVLLCLLALSLPMAAFAIDGPFHGSTGGEAVSANFEGQAEGASGTLTIGETHYILQIQKSENGYQGTLVNISEGYGATLLIQEQEGKLQLDIEREGKPSQHLELLPGNP